jgi:hypothetical protein
MAFPNPHQYAAAFAAALRAELTKQVASPVAAPVKPAPLDLNTDVCVFVGGRFLPRGSAPDFPHRTVLATKGLYSCIAFCYKHQTVHNSCLLEFDNYGNLLLRSDPEEDFTVYKRQFAVYFMRSTEHIADPVADVLALTLMSLMIKVASPPIMQRYVVCGERISELETSPGYVYCDTPYHYSCFPAGSKARMFADHTDDLSAEQREGAAALCSLLEEHFRRVLDPFYSALRALQAAVCTAPSAAPAPAPAANANVELVIATLTAQQTWLHEQIAELKMSLHNSAAPQTEKTAAGTQAADRQKYDDDELE